MRSVTVFLTMRVRVQCDGYIFMLMVIFGVGASFDSYVARVALWCSSFRKDLHLPAATVMRKRKFHKLEFKTWVEQNPPAGRRVYSSPFLKTPAELSATITSCSAH